MAVYSFHRVLVWDNLGGTVRVARNVRVDVLDPNTGALPAGLTQGGQAVTYLTTDSAGLAEFEATVPTVELTAPNGLVQRITSQDALEAAAGYTVSEDAAVAGAISAAGSASQAAVASRIDTHLGGDATGLITTVAGKVDKPKPGRNALTGWFHADGYGLKESNDAATNTTALANAFTAMSSGDVLYIPKGKYAITAFPAITGKAIHIMGVPGHCSNQQRYGHSSWTDGTADVTGTVLTCTATTGAALPIDGNGFTRGATIEHLTLVGPGTGTSIGLSAFNASQAMIRARLRNVTIANFSTGIYSNCENSQWDALFVTACKRGVDLVYPFNGNAVNGLNIERCDTVALSLDSCDTNTFTGGVIQACYGDSLVVQNGSYGNVFTGIYFENFGPGGGFDELRITNSQFNTVDRCHFGSGSTYLPRITLGAAAHRNLIRINGGGAVSACAVSIDAAANRNRVIGMVTGAITGAGVGANGNVVERLGDENAIYAPIGLSTASAANVNEAHFLAIMRGGGVVFHMPDPTTVPIGRIYRVKNGTSATNCSIDSLGASKTIDGAASKALAAWQAVSLISDGTQWFTI